MKTELVITENTASLCVHAETQFEKDALRILSNLEEKRVRISTNYNWEVHTEGRIEVLFNTKPTVQSA